MLMRREGRDVEENVAASNIPVAPGLGRVIVLWLAAFALLHKPSIAHQRTYLIALSDIPDMPE